MGLGGRVEFRAALDFQIRDHGLKNVGDCSNGLSHAVREHPYNTHHVWFVSARR